MTIDLTIIERTNNSIHHVTGRKPFAYITFTKLILIAHGKKFILSAWQITNNSIMVYRALGMMSGSSLDGLDIAFVEFEVSGSSWKYEFKATECVPYTDDWRGRLQNATRLSAFDYLQLHVDYGHYLGQKAKDFIAANGLEYKVQLIGSHGHTSFHSPKSRLTHQLGDGASIAAETGINVVSDLRSMDVAHGGEGAPIVPIGEKLLMPDYNLFLNIGGIANLSFNQVPFIAFDVCPANRVMNFISQQKGLAYDEDGRLAASGSIHTPLLMQLNELDYYQSSYPKSLSNSFGDEMIIPIIQSYHLSHEDALATYCEHISQQVKRAIANHLNWNADQKPRILVSGGGSFNSCLLSRIRFYNPQIEWFIADNQLASFKEALIMAFIAVLRWREEENTISSVTGAKRNSIGGAVWLGHN